jgi:hypothetical protein
VVFPRLLVFDLTTLRFLPIFNPRSDTQKDMRKKVEEKLKRTQKTKVQLHASAAEVLLTQPRTAHHLKLSLQALKYKDNDKARKTYESKYRESERADEEAGFFLVCSLHSHLSSRHRFYLTNVTPLLQNTYRHPRATCCPRKSRKSSGPKREKQRWAPRTAFCSQPPGDDDTHICHI